MFRCGLIYAYRHARGNLVRCIGSVQPSLEGFAGWRFATDASAGSISRIGDIAGSPAQAAADGRLTRYSRLAVAGAVARRLAVRLALTLHYAEVVMLRTLSGKTLAQPV